MPRPSPSKLPAGIPSASFTNWRATVMVALQDCGGEASLERLYAAVKTMAPVRTAATAHWKTKVRQVLQKSPEIENVSRGVWRLRPSTTRATTDAPIPPVN